MSHRKQSTSKHGSHSDNGGTDPPPPSGSLVQPPTASQLIKLSTRQRTVNKTDTVGIGSSTIHSNTSAGTVKHAAKLPPTKVRTSHPLQDTGDPYSINGNVATDIDSGGDDGNNGGDSSSSEHKRSRIQRSRIDTSVVPPLNGGAITAGTYDDIGTDTPHGGTNTRSTGTGARNIRTSGTPTIKYERRSTRSGGGDNTGGDSSDGNGSGSDSDGNGGGGHSPRKQRSTRRTIKQEAIGDDDDYFTLTKRYAVIDVIKTLPALPPSLVIKQTDIVTVKKYKRELELYLKQAGASDYAVKPSERSWLQLKYKYADAKNAWSVYSEFRAAHARLAATLCATMANVYPDLPSEMSISAEQYQRDHPNYIDEIDDINSKYTVNAYSGTFIIDNANLVYNVIMKRLDTVRNSVFHITNTMNEAHGVKYDGVTDPDRHRDHFMDKMNQLDAVLVGNKPLPGRMYPENIRTSMYIGTLPATGEYAQIRQTALNAPDGTITIDDVTNMMKRNYQWASAKTAGRHTGSSGGGGMNSNNAGGGQRTGTAHNAVRALAVLCNEQIERDGDLIETFDAIGLTIAGNTGNSSGNGTGGGNKHRRGKKKANGKPGAAISTFITTEAVESDGGTGTDSDTDSVNDSTVLPAQHVEDLDPRVIREVLQERAPVTRETVWIFDTGSTKSTVHNESLLVPQSIETVPALRIIGINSTKPLISTRCGDAKLNNRLTLQNVHIVPGSGVNIVSASELAKVGCEFQTKKNLLDVFYNGTIVITFLFVSGLWIYYHPRRFVNINPLYDGNDTNVKLNIINKNRTSTNSTSTSSTTTSTNGTNTVTNGGKHAKKIFRKKDAVGNKNKPANVNTTGGATSTTTATATRTATSGTSTAPKAATVVSNYVTTECSADAITSAVITCGTTSINDTSTSKRCTIPSVSMGNGTSKVWKPTKHSKTHVFLNTVANGGTSAGGVTTADTVTSNEGNSVVSISGTGTGIQSKTGKHVVGQLESASITESDGTGTTGTIIVTGNTNKRNGKVKYGPKMVITSIGSTGTVPMNGNNNNGNGTKVTDTSKTNVIVDVTTAGSGINSTTNVTMNGGDSNKSKPTGTTGGVTNEHKRSNGTRVGGGNNIGDGTCDCNSIALKATTVKQSAATTVYELHCQWGHRTITKSMLQAIGFTGDTTMVTGNGYNCDECGPTKMKANYTGGGTYPKPSIPGSRWDWDIIGPISYVNTFTGHRERIHSYSGDVYILVGTCPTSDFTVTYKLRHKNQADNHIINTCKYVQVQYGVTVTHIHSDGGTEFINGHLINYCKKNGIRQTYTTAGTPQHNGTAERKNGTLIQMVKSMLYVSGASVKLWCEAIQYATLVHNVTPSRTGGTSPMEQMTGTLFNLTKLQPFGCDCWVLPAADSVGKLQRIGQPGIFVGIATNQMDAPMIMTGTGTIVVTLNINVDGQSFEHVDSLVLNTKSLSTVDVICDESDRNDTTHIDTVSGGRTSNHAGWYGNGGSNSNGANSTDTGGVTGNGTKHSSDKTTVDTVTGNQRISYAGDDSSGDEFSDYEPSDDDSSTGTSSDEQETKYVDQPTTGTSTNGDGNQSDDGVISDTNDNDLSIVYEEDDTSGTSDSDSNGGDGINNGTEIPAELVPMSSLSSLPKPSQYSRSHVMVPSLPFETSLFMTGSEWGWDDFTGAVSYHSQYSYAARGGLLANFQRSSDMIINSNITEDDYIETVLSAVNEPYEPNTYKQAMKTREAIKWRAAVKEEYASLHENKVLTLVKRSSDMNILGTRLVFKVKTDENNAPIRWKARLVAKGYNQRDGIDFHDTYSPVARFSSMRTLISLAAIHDLEMKQIDFKTAFLNASLAEDIYIGVPPGYNDITGTPVNERTHCFKLNRALYGLKQSPLEWYKLLHIILTACGYKNTSADPCFYYKHVAGCSVPIMITVYVDDCIIAYPKQLENVWLNDKAKICETYKIDDLDDINFCLKMKIDRDRQNGTITISQYGYVMALLNEYKLHDLPPKENPCQGIDLSTVNESQPDGEVPLGVLDHELYRSMIGSLMYLGNTTRLDICYAVHFLARYLQKPLKKHLKAVKHIFQYLIGNPNYVLVYSRNGTTGGITNGINDTGAINFPNGIEYSQSISGGITYGGTTNKSAGTVHYHYLNGYTDSDWASDAGTRCSTSGGIVTLNGNIISWLCQKQKSISLSSTESEFYAVNALACDIKWFQDLLYELFEQHLTSVLFIDNQAAMHWTTNEAMSHKRSKHVDVRYKWVRQLLQEERIKVQWKESAHQLADILTKNTTKAVFVTLRNQLLGNVNSE